MGRESWTGLAGAGWIGERFYFVAEPVEDGAAFFAFLMFLWRLSEEELMRSISGAEVLFSVEAGSFMSSWSDCPEATRKALVYAALSSLLETGKLCLERSIGG